MSRHLATIFTSRRIAFAILFLGFIYLNNRPGHYTALGDNKFMVVGRGWPVRIDGVVEESYPKDWTGPKIWEGYWESRASYLAHEIFWPYMILNIIIFVVFMIIVRFILNLLRKRRNAKPSGFNAQV